jgi:tetratricopeptide (TPR) repeat protein
MPRSVGNLEKKRNLWFWLVGLALGALGHPALALSTDPSTAFPVLSAGMGARATALGESFTAVADDFSALQYNPAGLSQVSHDQLFLIHNAYLGDGFYEDLGGTYCLGETGTLAYALDYLNYGSIPKRDAFGNLLGTYTPYDMGFGAAFGFNLRKDLSIGFGSRWIRQDIDGSVHMGLMWEAGVLEKPDEHLSFGLNLRNAGVESGGYSLPTELLVGTALKMPLAARDSQSLLIALGGDLGFLGGNRLGAGLEYGIEKKYFLRAGYQLDLFNSSSSSLNGLSFGGGLSLGPFQLDYSFSFMGDLGNLQRFSLGYTFPGTPKPKADPAPVLPPPPPLNPGAFSDLGAPPPGQDPAASVPSAPGGALSQASPSQPGGKGAAVTMEFVVTANENLTPQQCFDQAEVKLKMGLKEEALDLYLKAVEKDPHFQKAWDRLGRLYFDKSLESYRKLLELNPQNERLREWLRQYPQ